jgi:hypothetical protein
MPNMKGLLAMGATSLFIGMAAASGVTSAAFEQMSEH